MATKVVTYDLNKEIIRPAITKKLKEKWPTWAMLSESCYAIETDMDNWAIFNALKPVLDENDALFVFNLNQPVAGFGPGDVVDWIDELVK